MKSILGILAVCLVAGCGKSSSGPARPDPAAAIRQVVQQDKAAHDEIAATIGVWDRIWGNPKKIALYAQRLKQIDLSPCPQEFQDAFLKHAYAWGKLAVVADSASGLKGIMRGMGGVDVTPEVHRAQREVSDTWMEVDRIARRYQVNVNGL
jgi:hypothetical protein